jgi:predicted HTH domain antitoxin
MTFMKTLSVNVPESLLLNSSSEELTRQSEFFLALKFFELGRLTSSQAAEMCGMNRVDFLVSASQAGTPVADLDAGELQEEIRNHRP